MYVGVLYNHLHVLGSFGAAVAELYIYVQLPKIILRPQWFFYCKFEVLISAELTIIQLPNMPLFNIETLP